MTTYDYFDYLLVGAGPAAAAAANEKYMITPTAGVILKNKKYFIALVMVFDIFMSPPIICNRHMLCALR